MVWELYQAIIDHFKLDHMDVFPGRNSAPDSYTLTSKKFPWPSFDNYAFSSTNHASARTLLSIGIVGSDSPDDLTNPEINLVWRQDPPEHHLLDTKWFVRNRRWTMDPNSMSLDRWEEGTFRDQYKVVEMKNNPQDSRVCVRVACNDGLPKFIKPCLLYTSPSPRDLSTSRVPSSA